MDYGVFAAYAGLVLTVLGGVYKFGQIRQELESVKADLAELKAHNEKQHAELYESRNNTSEILSRLTALFEAMKDKQDSMDRKLDALLERRAKERE